MSPHHPPGSASRSMAAIALIVVMGLGSRSGLALASTPDSEVVIAPADLDGLVSPLIREQLDRYHIPGAVFVAVKDGQVVLARGYGFGDLETEKPVTPDQTLFNVGSVTKLFTATAIMQLSEKGLLDLEADVNTYLSAFRIPDTYPDPVTPAALMTHTAGFGEKIIGMSERSPDEVIRLGDYLAAELPPRVRPVGEAVQYSNHGYALLAYLVESLSGVPYEDYVKANISGPLGMGRTSFSLEAEQRADLAVSYLWGSEGFQAQPPHYLNTTGAGDLKTTGLDMARFMVAFLQGGRYGGARILSEDTAALMTARQFGVSPELAGYCYGFYEDPRNGERIIAHGGDAPEGTASHMWLVPEHDFGFFVAYNSGSSGSAREKLLQAVMDRYFPGEASGPVTPGAGLTPDEVRAVEGTYRSVREDTSSFLALPTILIGATPEFRVKAAGNGQLLVTPALGGPEPVHLTRLGAGGGGAPGSPGLLTYQMVADPDLRVAFEVGPGGRAERMVYVSPLLTMDRVPWYGTLSFQVVALGSIGLVLASGLVAWPVAALIDRRKKRLAGRATRLARLMGFLTAATVLGFLAGFAVVMLSLGNGIAFGVPALLQAILALPLVAAGLALGMVAAAFRLWRERLLSLAGRVHYSLAAAMAVAFAVLAVAWRLYSSFPSVAP